MDLNLLKWQLLRGTLLRRVVLRAFVFMIALVIVSLLQIYHDVRMIESELSDFAECSSPSGSEHEFNLTGPFNSELTFPFALFGTYKMSKAESQNLTVAVFEELVKEKLLHSNARALCVGDGSAYAKSVLRRMGFSNATIAIQNHPFFSILKRKFVYELQFKDNEFDFVFSEDLDRVSVPSLMVSELERVLNPGGTGAVVVGAHKFYIGGLVRSQIPVVSFLKSSEVVRICHVGSYALVIFKKRLDDFATFERFQLPSNCPSVANNKPFMKYIEPLIDHSVKRQAPEISYLPQFVNISTRNKLIYMNIGAGEFAKSSVAKISEAYNGFNSHRRAAFDAFVVDQRTSVLASFLSEPGFNFVYYPLCSGESYAPEISSDEHLSAPMEEEAGFNLSHWFEETVSDGDFTVLMMNAKTEELSILVELFESVAICHVDELFLLCSDCANTACDKCSNVLRSLRKSGVYAHLWLGDSSA